MPGEAEEVGRKRVLSREESLGLLSPVLLFLQDQFVQTGLRGAHFSFHINCQNIFSADEDVKI